MINRARGETGLVISGRLHRLCLTLGTLAEIESLPAEETPEARFWCLLDALLRGGGASPGLAALKSAKFDKSEAIRAILACFEPVQ